MKPFLRIVYRWVAQVADPLTALRALKSMPRFFSEYRRYGRMKGAEPLSLREAIPAIHDASGSHVFDPHYFFLNAWAARRILSLTASSHIDVGSQSVLSTILSAVRRVTYVDYRPLMVHLTKLSSVSANVTALPFRDDSIRSLSCLHVAEHVGLGRYGDPLDPLGTIRTAAELSRVLAPGGDLFFALPIGRTRVQFNAHRIHSAAVIRDCFRSLDLVEYSGVGDDAKFVENVPLVTFEAASYACGMFWFRKPMTAQTAPRY